MTEQSSTAQAELGGKAKEMLHDARDKAVQIKDGVMRAARENADHVTDAALHLADKAKEGVSSSVERQKSAGADYIELIAQATERAANEFDKDIPQAANFIRQASAQVHSIADTVREKNARELVGEVQDFARRQPTLFFGGAVILGFAALRFLKSASPAASSNKTPEARV